MQVLVLLLALLALTNAQHVPGGCCMYTLPNYQGEATCTNSSIGFNFEVKVQSIFCVEQYSAAFFDKANLIGDPIVLVGCGEEIPTLVQPMPVNSVSVGPCARVSCCFYTGADFSEGEYCVATGVAPPSKDELVEVQKAAKFKSMRCNPGNTALLTRAGGSLNVPCGGEVKPSASYDFTAIAVSACTGGAKALGEEFVEGSIFGDVDQAIPVEEALIADQAISDDDGDTMRILPVDLPVDSADEETFVEDNNGDMMHILPIDFPVDSVGEDVDQAGVEMFAENIMVDEGLTAEEADAAIDQEFERLEDALADQLTADEVLALTADEALAADQALADFAFDEKTEGVTSGTFSVTASFLVGFVSIFVLLL